MELILIVVYGFLLAKLQELHDAREATFRHFGRDSTSEQDDNYLVLEDETLDPKVRVLRHNTFWFARLLDNNETILSESSMDVLEQEGTIESLIGFIHQINPNGNKSIPSSKGKDQEEAAQIDGPSSSSTSDSSSTTEGSETESSNSESSDDSSSGQEESSQEAFNSPEKSGSETAPSFTSPSPKDIFYVHEQFYERIGQEGKVPELTEENKEAVRINRAFRAMKMLTDPTLKLKKFMRENAENICTFF
eukprot:TRINITY_DN221_c4_g1_i5.p1 TRINITY_DN221_c4_g1~~TRINITY_DN221_c4_g1_i5.p1  ORF type:complete len:249 (-),score=66.42 TRINITY_DN221_c4_g1_i5:133-879(-)